jgi:diguanylate cyclase (GGDEF)-like protein
MKQGFVNRKLVQLQEKYFLLKSNDFDECVQFSMKLLSRFLKAEDVFYIEKDKLDYYAHELWKITSLHNSLNSRGRGTDPRTIHFLKSHKNEDVSLVIAELNQTLGSGWESKLESQVVANGEIKWMIYPVVLNEEIHGYFFFHKPVGFNRIEIPELFTRFSPFLAQKLDQAREFTRMRELTYVDDLTELYNQRYLPIALDKSIERYEASSECFSVLFMDIDHFKKVNDSKGHIIGSRILVELGKILKQNIRSVDYGFRYGGDEFLLILTNTDPQTANIIAERIRKQVESTIFEMDQRKLQITLSIGIACFPLHAKTRQDVLEMADKAMYYGKNKSRNIVFMAS